MKNKYALDASALLVLINSEPGHEVVANYMPDACISAINLSEVASILHKIEMPKHEIASLLNELISEVVVFDKSQAYLTAELNVFTKHLGLSLGDRACLALGKTHNIPVITADRAWLKLKLDTLGIKVILIR